MINQKLNAKRRRAPGKYIVIAAAFALASMLGLEAAGTVLTTSYPGLGGKLTPVRAGASEIAPGSAPDYQFAIQ